MRKILLKIYDPHKAFGIQTGTSDKRPVDLIHVHYLRCVLGFYAASVLDYDFVTRIFVIQSGDRFSYECTHFSGLPRGCGFTGTYGPDRLVCNHDSFDILCAYAFKVCAKLCRNNLLCLAFFALPKVFPNLTDRKSVV